MTREVMLQLSEPMGRLVEGLVESGDFRNPNEVIHSALRLLEERNSIFCLEDFKRIIEEEDNGADVANIPLSRLKLKEG